MIDALLGIKLIYIFGIINALSIAMAFSTCRCLIGFRFVNEMLKRPWYRWVFDHHCWYWRIFFVSMILHGILVFIIFGDPLLTFGIPNF